MIYVDVCSISGVNLDNKIEYDFHDIFTTDTSIKKCGAVHLAYSEIDLHLSAESV